jgi:hypothetical protein
LVLEDPVMQRPESVVALQLSTARSLGRRRQPRLRW